MTLAFDFGNSQVKVGLFNIDGLEPFQVQTFAYERDFQEFETLVQSFKTEIPVIHSSVLAPTHPFLSVLSYFKNAIILSYKLKLPFELGYKSPETLGQDRIAACAGAVTILKSLPLLVIDAGTCITYDFINEQNCYLGGAISPGIELKLRAMHEFTGKLPKPTLPIDYEPFNIGKTTRECLLEGAVAGTIHEINGFIATFARNKPLNVILTGGSAQYLANKLENSTFAAPNLVLVGLHKIRMLNAQ